ncbi:MAG TPA: dTDP-4-dehydrorhamnose reductase [Chthonomonas sp.]|jgi:dTDP-4-dehydrorhamnose reductase|uniref:dTDP-4-dehydrorhamnose reductase n=1 Tax=Chthonomonas sp. TaxID=2282153 RepID=UPI002B4B1B32|nr:dTDP-4-dehydrorhamnose reductase [Chthonomonas sp.]HLH79709.1 dTDP-4-dehydrorhamnose reductase [Chthonomonas sp.]
MRILVTGANGMLGTDLCCLLEQSGHEVIRSSQRENTESDVTLDILDFAATRATLRQHKPEMLIHTAAYTHVDGCERDPDRAFQINALGTWHVAAACAEQDIPLVYISTDFVFDGRKTTPYTEFDTPNPINHYGASKLAGEQAVQKLCRRHYIVRTQWLFGVHGKNFPGTILELAQKRNELPVVVDQRGSPTSTLALSRALIKLLDSPLYGTYHIACKGECSWFEFAQKTLELAGISHVTLHPIPAEQWPSPTHRPAYSVLRRYVLELQGRDDLPPWQEALEEFIELLKAKK